MDDQEGDPNEWMSMSIFFPAAVMSGTGISRGTVDYELEEALAAEGLGEEVGGGAGIKGWDIEFEVPAVKFDRALAVIRRVLRDLGVPPSIHISAHPGGKYPVYDEPI